MCLHSALDLWPPGHFALGFFASRIGRSEMECSALGFSYVRWKPRNGQLAKMGSFHQSKRSDNKWYAVEVRWVIFIYNLTYCIYKNSYNSAITVIVQDDHLTAGAWAACAPMCPFNPNTIYHATLSLPHPHDKSNLSTSTHPSPNQKTVNW